MADPNDLIGKITSGVDEIGQELDSVRTDGGAQVILKAVVTHVLNDPAYFSPDEYELIEDNITNPDFLVGAPRNSIVARIITGGQDKQGSSQLMCYPFFPPHICFPVKPGEQVWLIRENSKEETSIGYWMCRIPGSLVVDDINYTHADRRFNESSKGDTVDEKEGSDEVVLPGYPNGAGDENSTSLNEEDGFEKVWAACVTALALDPEQLEAEADPEAILAHFTPEPVPRFTKRMGDMVLQGSNNTLICLGEDRGWSKEEPPLSDPTDHEGEANLSNATRAEDEAKGFAGSIDIVAGRGRLMLDDKYEFTDTANIEANPVPTTKADAKGEDAIPGGSVRLIESSDLEGRTGLPSGQILEVDKNPVANMLEEEFDRLHNPSEGDPDFHNDASRVYVSMKTSGDENFNITKDTMPNIPTPLTAETAVGGHGVSVSDSVPYTPMPESPYIVMKSNEIRIIARQRQDDAAAIKENGSIKIIKEGDPFIDGHGAGKGRGVIMIEKDGSILIDGPRVIIGSGDSKTGGLNNEGVHVAIGYGATESMMLGNKFTEMLIAYLEKIQAFCQTIGPEVGNMGGPLASIKSGASDLDGDTAAFITELDKGANGPHLSKLAKLS
jgi:hypothetical protein